MRSSAHYLGQEGERYFAWQRGSGVVSAILDPPVFQRYIGPDDTVLDFGCGTGALLVALTSGPKLGVEVNEAARRAAAGAGIRVAAGSEEFPPESVDVVISNHALEHVLEPLAELRSLHRIMKPGAKLVLRLPIDDWRVQRTPVDDGSNHLFTWTPRLIGNLLREAAFVVDDAHVVNHAWPPRAEALLARLPRFVFDGLARMTAVALRRRQLFVVARRSSSA